MARRGNTDGLVRLCAYLALMLAAVFNLNHHASYVHWHFISLSVSNILMIAAMFVVFFAAILLPFPRGARKESS